MQRLLETMRTLRGPGGCPWDQEQTHASLRPYLLEEAAEAVDAIGSGDPLAMSDELGDVLLQVAFHSVIAEETESFAYEDIETSIVDKLVRRHPHVFAGVSVADADEVVTNWQAIKAAEKAGASDEAKPEDRVPHGLPALMRAAALGKRLEWPPLDAAAVTEAGRSLEPTEESVGALLLAVVDYARAAGIDPELALRDAANLRAAGG